MTKEAKENIGFSNEDKHSPVDLQVYSNIQETLVNIREARVRPLKCLYFIRKRNLIRF